MIARRTTADGGAFGESAEFVQGASEFEGFAALENFEFEMDVAANEEGKIVGTQDGSDVRMVVNTFCSSVTVFEGNTEVGGHEETIGYEKDGL
jgi:hypothetical protein